MKQLFLCFFLCLTNIIACSQAGYTENNPQTGRANFLLQQAEIHQKRGDVEKSLKYFDDAIREAPNRADLRAKKGNMLVFFNREKEAKFEYDKAISLNPYADVYFRFDAKMKIFRASVMNPSNLLPGSEPSNFSGNIGSLKQSVIKKEFLFDANISMDDKMDTLEKYEKLLPNKSEILNLKGLLLLNEKNYKQAISFFTEAIELNPKCYASYLDRALAYFESGKNEKAYEDLNFVINSNQYPEQSLTLKAYFLKSEGKYSESLDQYNKLLLTSDTISSARLNRAYLLKIMGDYHASFADLEIFLKQNPNSAEGMNNAGINRALFGDYEQAIRFFNKALNYKTNFPEAKFNLAFTKILAGNLTGGCLDLESIMSESNHEIDHYYKYFCNK